MLLLLFIYRERHFSQNYRLTSLAGKNCKTRLESTIIGKIVEW